MSVHTNRFDRGPIDDYNIVLTLTKSEAHHLREALRIAKVVERMHAFVGDDLMFPALARKLDDAVKEAMPL